MLNLILELSDTVHMRQFLQHDAAMRLAGVRKRERRARKT